MASLLTRKMADEGGVERVTASSNGEDRNGTQYQGFQVYSPVLEGDRLLYAGRDCYLIPEELYSYADKVRALDLSFNSISDLVGVEKFSPSLEELILDNNQISESTQFPLFSKLKLLSLCNNSITDLYSFIDRVERKFPVLVYLSLIGNKACPDSLTQEDVDESDYERYRKYVIYKFPTLKFLDSKPVTVSERKEAKRTGQYLRPVKPSTPTDDELEESGRNLYNPLPTSSSSQFTPGNEKQEPRGTFKKAKYVYHGKHSEGNRFIRNNDL